MSLPDYHFALVADDSLYKEEQTYRVESAEAKQNVEKLKKANADGADIRNAVSQQHIAQLSAPPASLA